MKKTIYSDEYSIVTGLLKELRTASGVTQIQMAEYLQLNQSLFSKYERGEIRLDIIQLRTIARRLGLTLPQFSEMLEQRLTGAEAKQPCRSKSSTRRKPL